MDLTASPAPPGHYDNIWNPWNPGRAPTPNPDWHKNYESEHGESEGFGDDEDEERSEKGVEGVEDDDEEIIADLDTRLDPVWELHSVILFNRQKEIKEKAVEVVEDAFLHADMPIKRKSEDYMQMVVKIATKFARKYHEIRLEKESHRERTPMGKVFDSASLSSRSGNSNKKSSTKGTVSPKFDIHPNITMRPNPVPRVNNWADRVAYQKMRNQMLAQKGESYIEDQGVIFEGHIAKEAPPHASTIPNVNNKPTKVIQSKASEKLPNQEVTTHKGGYKRGFSMPLSTIENIDTPGQPKAKIEHKRAMENRLIRIIDENLGARMELPTGVKLNLKLDTNEKFGGSAKFSTLENWLLAICHSFAIRQLGGNDMDTMRTKLIGEFLKGEAHNFYSRHVASPQRSKIKWTFKEVILGLYEHFVHPSSMQDAREGFKKAKYNHVKGIQAFYNSLMEFAQNMYDWPDKYTILEKFMDGIPEDMKIHLLKDIGLSPEMNSITEFVGYAIRYEKRVKTLTYYQKKDTLGHNENIRNPNIVRRGNKIMVLRSALSEEAAVKTTDKPLEQANREQPKASKDTKTDNRAQTSGNNRRGPNVVKCYNCGKEGHMARECPIPREKRLHLKAARTAIPDDNDADVSGSEELEENMDIDGMDTRSQASEYTEVEMVGSEWYENDEYSEGDHVAAMRVRAIHKIFNCDSDGDDSCPELDPISDSDDEDPYQNKRAMALYPELERIENNEDDPEVANGDAVFMTAMTDIPEKDAKSLNGIKMRKVKIRTIRKCRMRPQVKPEHKLCLATFTNIAGMDAWTLWDSGSTTTGITPSFAQIADISVDTLLDPHILQLGTTGSCSVIKYGADVQVVIGNKTTTTYVDVANFDRYDMIMGTPFMHEHKVVLDFNKLVVRVNGEEIPAIKVSRPDADSRLCRQRATEGQKEQLD
ncbi:hypothetical protein JR316_0007534 [Psilocybe cubensis]|uniref:CCHC-type domain-containing protein n=2 Tax=Psilocybe cubensis TaxID=181762 RepID=A0A8H8CHA1_PSICU|nr:hypothetical protein JR316_0007534 [Psilocybe cubensis]KAH9480931.1 hypothetical protein JR316_0007534 [Psilocybe cubensis]